MIKEKGLKTVWKRKFVRTTDSKHNLPVFESILNRQFTPMAANQAWVSDITYIRTQRGWLYLAAVLDLDLYSRKIVGWAMASTMPAELVCTALQIAITQRNPPAGLIVHSDRGSQYASLDYQQLLDRYQLQGSMSRKGNCWDTQYKIPLNVRPNLTRAGIGVIAFVLTCRLVTGVLRYSPDLLLVT